MAKMTVSQALRAIADLKGKIAKHKEHAQPAVLYSEKEKPAFNFKVEMEGMQKARAEMLTLQTALAVANATTEIEWKGKKVLVAWAIRYLEELKGEIKFIDELTVTAQSEIVQETPMNRLVSGQYQTVVESRKTVCELPAAEQFQKTQALQEEFNRLNDIVETSNHQVFIREA